MVRRDLPFDIAVLRKIGFDRWDPLGGWVPPDEYDSYLLKAAGDLWHGKAVEDVAAYLANVEREVIGLGPSEALYERALHTATAINSHVQTLRL
jgi:hypothetical protein